METRLYNIFKSKNATELTHPTLESSYNVLLDKILFVTIKQPCIFYGPLNFQELLAFKLIQIWQYCEKSCGETTFFESLDKSLKTRQDSFSCDHPVGSIIIFCGCFWKVWKCQNSELYVTVNIIKLVNSKNFGYSKSTLLELRAVEPAVLSIRRT